MSHPLGAALYRELRAQLIGVYPPTEAEAMLRVLFQAVASVPAHGLLAQAQLGVDPAAADRLRAYTSRLLNHEPLQYVLGWAEFCDATLRVTPDVLIPRPETEELVAWALAQELPRSPAILDIGTGSGCIAIALAMALPHARVTALDVCPRALAVASENALANRVTVQLIRHDILTDSPAAIPHGPFDLIVSNPPYVRGQEKAQMQPNVLSHEPHLALFVPNDNPLAFYRAIARQAETLLKPNGWVICEMNEYMGSETRSLFEQEGLARVEVREDIHGKERMIRAALR